MIISKEVEINISNGIINHYRNLGYKIIPGEKTTVKVCDLTKGSNVKIEVECDICHERKTLMYQKYLKNIKIGGYYSCLHCEITKAQNTCLEKFGCKSPLQNIEIKKNLENYFIEEYGVKNTSQLEDSKTKREQTMLEKYGVKTNILLPETHKKAIKSSCSDKSKEKRKQTTLERFGFENSMQSKIIQEKFKQTNRERYGVDYPAQNIEIHDKTNCSGIEWKIYKNIKYQGTYELDFIKLCDKLGILEKIERGMTINYEYESDNKIHFPDFYMKEKNLIIEIKSNYYYNLYIEQNKSKQKTCLDLGYNYIFIIDKNYEEFLKII